MGFWGFGGLGFWGSTELQRHDCRLQLPTATADSNCREQLPGAKTKRKISYRLRQQKPSAKATPDGAEASGRCRWLRSTECKSLQAFVC